MSLLDFSQYGGPSDEWLELQKTLPANNFDTSADPRAIQKMVNDQRDAQAAEMYKSLAPHVHMKEYAIPTRDGSTIAARTYRSVEKADSEKLPVHLYFHGGGFIFGTQLSEEPLAAQAAIVTGVVTVNVNYRHTPEHVYPTAFNDTHDALFWVHLNIDTIGGDASKVTVGGVSAGAQLAASLTLEQHVGKDELLTKLPKLAGQVLIIPCLASPFTYDEGPGKKLRVSSYVENEHAPLLPKTVIEFYMTLLNADTRDLKNTKVNMVNASEGDVKGLPPTVFGIAGLDPLRDEGLLYAKLLAEAGVPTNITIFKGVPHGYRSFNTALKASQDWDRVVHEGITWALSKPEATGKFNVKVAGPH